MIHQDRFRPSIHVCLALLAWWFQAAMQPAEAASYSLGLPVNLPGGDSVWHRPVAVGDVNQDGRDDIVVGQGAEVWIRLQTAAGQMAPPQVHRLPAQPVNTIDIVDIDRDGAAEMVVGYDAGLAIYHHARGWRYAPGGAGCQLLALGDIDLDGWVDVACAGGAGLVSLYINDRQGGFAVPTYMWTPSHMLNGGGVGQMLLEDVTGDGRPDLLVSTSGDTGVYVHAHDGSRGFLPAYGIAQAGLHLHVSGLAVLDVDSDGVAEILTAGGCSDDYCAALQLFRRDALGYYRHAEEIPTLDNPSWPVVHDLDGNGAPDLLVPHSGMFAVGRYMGNSAGGLSRSEVPAMVATGSVGPRGLGPGDVDSDGCTDVVIANQMGLSVLHGICSGGRGADFDGDHQSDVFWRNTATGGNLIWPSADANRALPVQAVTQTAWRIVGQGDFDGDLRSDLLWRHATTGANAIWLSADFGTPRAVAGVSDVRWQVVGVGDFDGDRRSDILWRHASTGANAIWKSGRHDSQQPIMAVSDVRWRVAGVGDFDGDGRSDILWRHSATGANAIWLSGRHDTPHDVEGVPDLRWQVAGLGDFDGDGTADIFWRHGADGQNAIWLGAQAWARWPVMGVTNLGWKVAAIGDYDASGSSDVLWRNSATGANAIWRSADYGSQIPVASRAGPWVVVPGP